MSQISFRRFTSIVLIKLLLGGVIFSTERELLAQWEHRLGFDAFFRSSTLSFSSGLDSQQLRNQLYGGRMAWTVAKHQESWRAGLILSPWTAWAQISEITDEEGNVSFSYSQKSAAYGFELSPFFAWKLWSNKDGNYSDLALHFPLLLQYQGFADSQLGQIDQSSLSFSYALRMAFNYGIGADWQVSTGFALWKLQLSPEISIGASYRLD